MKIWHGMVDDKRPKVKTEFVYLAGRDWTLNRPVKIGRTLRLKARLSSLQNGNPYPLHYLALIVGDHEIEQSLHRRFASQRMQGEWFKMDRALRDAMWPHRKHITEDLDVEWEAFPCIKFRCKVAHMVDLLATPRQFDVLAPQ